MMLPNDPPRSFAYYVLEDADYEGLVGFRLVLYGTLTQTDVHRFFFVWRRVAAGADEQEEEAAPRARGLWNARAAERPCVVEWGGCERAHTV